MSAANAAPAAPAPPPPASAPPSGTVALLVSVKTIADQLSAASNPVNTTQYATQLVCKCVELMDVSSSIGAHLVNMTKTLSTPEDQEAIDMVAHAHSVVKHACSDHTDLVGDVCCDAFAVGSLPSTSFDTACFALKSFMRSAQCLDDTCIAVYFTAEFHAIDAATAQLVAGFNADAAAALRSQLDKFHAGGSAEVPMQRLEALVAHGHAPDRSPLVEELRNTLDGLRDTCVAREKVCTREMCFNFRNLMCTWDRLQASRDAVIAQLQALPAAQDGEAHTQVILTALRGMMNVLCDTCESVAREISTNTGAALVSRALPNALHYWAGPLNQLDLDIVGSAAGPGFPVYYAHPCICNKFATSQGGARLPILGAMVFESISSMFANGEVADRITEANLPKGVISHILVTAAMQVGAEVLAPVMLSSSSVVMNHTADDEVSELLAAFNIQHNAVVDQIVSYLRAALLATAIVTMDLFQHGGDHADAIARAHGMFRAAIPGIITPWIVMSLSDLGRGSMDQGTVMPAEWQPALDRMNAWAAAHPGEMPSMVDLVGEGAAPAADGQEGGGGGGAAPAVDDHGAPSEEEENNEIVPPKEEDALIEEEEEDAANVQ